MRHLYWLVLLTLAGCSSGSVLGDWGGGTPHVPQRVRMYSGDPRAVSDITVISQVSDSCSFVHKDDKDLTTMYSVILSDGKSGYSSGDIYEFLPGYYPFQVTWLEDVSRFVVDSSVSGIDGMTIPIPYDQPVSFKTTDFSFPLSLKAGQNYRLSLERVEGKQACRLCVEEMPRDNYGEPMTDLSKKLQCRVLQ